tara:strand:- start:159 stop:2423 length:2265 start_codon:yes stop_codon:yes gene_type:complete
VLKVQKCRWKKRLLVEKDGLGSSATLLNMLEFMIYQKNIYNKFIKFIMFNNNINMPYKIGKLKGLLTTAEIRKLIVSHNKLVKLSIPKGSNRDDLIKLIAKNGYRINHAKGVIEKGGSLLKQPPPAKKQTSFKSEVATTKPYVLSKKEKNEKIKTIDKIDKDKKENKNNKNLEEQIKDSWDQDELNYKKQYNTLVKKNSKNELVESDKVKLTKLFNDIKEDYITLEGGIIQQEMKSWSPIVTVMKNIKKIISGIDKKPPAKKVSVVKPPPAKKVTPPKKDIYKISKEAQKKIDYDDQIEERLKNLNDDVKSNKNVFGETGDSKQGVFMKLFTDIDKLGRGGIPKDFSLKSIKYAQNLLNIVYRNPPKDREGLIMPEQAFKPKGIFNAWRSYLTDTSATQRRKVMKGYNEDKKPAVKKVSVKKPAEDTKQAQEGENRIDIYGTQGDKKRLIVKQDKTFNTIKNILDKDGYVMTKQQEDLFKGNIVDYVKEQKKPARINIKPAKGKTDMMIISIEGHSFGQGVASIRIKKKEVKKPAVKIPTMEEFNGKEYKKAVKDLNEIMKEYTWADKKMKERAENQILDKDGKLADNVSLVMIQKHTTKQKIDNGNYRRNPFLKVETRSRDYVYDKGPNFSIRLKRIDEVKKPAPPPAEEEEEEEEEDERSKRKEIKDMSDPLVTKLREVVQSIRNKAKKDAKADKSKVTIKSINKTAGFIGGFVEKLENDNKIRFSEQILEKYQYDLIRNLRDDLKEIAGLK